MRNNAPVLLTALLVALLPACDPAPPEPEPEEPLTEVPEPALQQELYRSFREDADPALRRLRPASGGFQDAINGLLGEPDDERLETARNAWHKLYEYWNRSFVILATRAGEDPEATERMDRIDPVPIMPGYVDSLHQWPESGLVHDATVPLNRDTLLEQHDRTALGEATTGFQVIHFLLFGEPDHERGPEDLQEENADAANDHPDNSGQTPNQRRRIFLNVATELLVDDLAWMARHAGRNGNSGALHPTRLLQGLDRALERLTLLEELREDARDPAGGKFLAPDAGETARPPLRSAVEYWFSGDGRQALLASLEETNPDFAQTLAEKTGEEFHSEELLLLMRHGSR